MQIFNRLENDLNFALPIDVPRAHALDDLRRDFLRRKRLVNFAHVVGAGRVRDFGAAQGVDFIEHRRLAAFFEQRHRRLESHELAELRHINAVAIRITNLWRRRHDHDLPRVEPREDTQNRFTQRRPAHDGIVHADQIIAGFHGAVSDVVDVARELVAHAFLADKRADLDILAHDFFPARPVAQNEVVEERFVELARRAGLENSRFDLVAPPRT